MDSLDDFVSGMQGGYDWGAGVQDRLHQLAALTANGRTWGRQQPPQQPRIPATPPVSMPPMNAAPQMPARPMQPPPIDPGMAGNPRPPMALPQQAPGGMPPPQQQPQQAPPDPNLSSAAQPGAMGMDDPGMAAAQTLHAMGQATKRANPNIDPLTLAMAVQSQVEQIKGIAPLTKAYMTMQSKAMELQVRQQWAYQKFQQNQERIDLIRDDNERKRQTMENIDWWHHAVVAETQVRDEYAHEDRQASIGQRDVASQRSLEGREYSADRELEGRKYTADSGAAGKDASTIQNAWNSAFDAATRQGKNPAQAAQFATASIASAGAVVRGTRGRSRNVGPTGPISRSRPVSGGGGARPQPSASDISYLKQHPNLKAQFAARFGQAAADAALR